MSVPPFSPPTSLYQALALTDDEQRAMVDFLRRLVQTPSHSAHEGEVAAMVEKELRAVGVENVRIDQVGNVIGYLGGESGPTLLYDAHMDTVQATQAAWPHPPYEAVIQDGVLYGLGACDMKGSLAAMVYAAKRLVESGVELGGRLVMTFVVQEEPCEGAALKALLQEEAVRPDWVVLGEPSGMNIMRGHRGRVLFKVTTHGKSSHASSPHLGRNAIAAAARLIFGIDLLAAQLPSDPFLGSGTITVTHIESQAPSLNAIPDACLFYVDRRLTLGETPTRAQAQIEAVIEREGIQASIEIAEYRVPSYAGYELCAREAFNAWALDRDHPLIRMLSDVAQAVVGQTPDVGHWPFSTDGVVSMGELGIPTIGFGPGDPRHAHTVDDQVRLHDVAQAAQAYALLAAALLPGEE